MEEVEAYQPLKASLLTLVMCTHGVTLGAYTYTYHVYPLRECIYIDNGEHIIITIYAVLFVRWDCFQGKNKARKLGPTASLLSLFFGGRFGFSECLR